MQKSDYEFTMVKEEMDAQEPVADKTLKVNDLMYIKVIAFPVSKFSVLCRVLKYHLPKYLTLFVHLRRCIMLSQCSM